jgi:hypothetical protein
MLELTVTQPGQIIEYIVVKTGHVKKNCLKLKKKHASNQNSNCDRQMYDSQDVAFMATSENHNLSNDIWICDRGACGHYCNFKEGLFDVKEIWEDITVGNSRTMTATMVGSLKCNVIQLHGPSVVITLHEVKYVPEL